MLQIQKNSNTPIDLKPSLNYNKVNIVLKNEIYQSFKIDCMKIISSATIIVVKLKSM